LVKFQLLYFLAHFNFMLAIFWYIDEPGQDEVKPRKFFWFVTLLLRKLLSIWLLWFSKTCVQWIQLLFVLWSLLCIFLSIFNNFLKFRSKPILILDSQEKPIDLIASIQYGKSWSNLYQLSIPICPSNCKQISLTKLELKNNSSKIK
jgi:glucan phosphoethanolaminetransferase (alkaline phosphatase superfamily)